MSAALALIAHDLKNALGVLEAELGAMVAIVAEPSTLLAYKVHNAHNAHEHCGDLRRQFVQFLTLYGAETEGLRALCEDESPLELLQSLQKSWQAKLTRAGLDLQVRIKADGQVPDFWYFDLRLVQLALDAAIHNATRFAHSWIDLSVNEETREGARRLVWRITDDGPGLGSDDHCQHATGLGSALCESVAQVHQLNDRQGSISLHNAPEGGACFEMHLP